MGYRQPTAALILVQNEDIITTSPGADWYADWRGDNYKDYTLTPDQSIGADYKVTYKDGVTVGFLRWIDGFFQYTIGDSTEWKKTQDTWQ